MQRWGWIVSEIEMTLRALRIEVGVLRYIEAECHDGLLTKTIAGIEKQIEKLWELTNQLKDGDE